MKNPVERAYIGISQGVGKEVARQANGTHVDAMVLRTIDRLVVAPHFWDKYLDKPAQIILQSTRDGYEVV